MNAVVRAPCTSLLAFVTLFSSSVTPSAHASPIQHDEQQRAPPGKMTRRMLGGSNLRRRALPESPLPLDVCFNALANADNDGNDYLEQAEYVSFLNDLTNDAFGGSMFAELPVVVRSTYTALVVSSGMPELYVFGSRDYQTPDPDQLGFLTSICFLTDQALDTANVEVVLVTPEPAATASPTSAPPTDGSTTSSPTAAPTEGTTTTSPTAAPTESSAVGTGTSSPTQSQTQTLPLNPPAQGGGEREEDGSIFVQVFTSILVSNTLGLDAAALSFGSIRGALNRAYVALVEEVAGEIIAITGQDVDFAVSLVLHNTRLGYLQNRNCPISIYAYHVSRCQVGTGAFILSLTPGESVIEQQQALDIQARFQQAIDDSIVSGRMQQLLEQSDPLSPLTIDLFSLHANEGTIAPLEISFEEATAPPSEQPGSSAAAFWDTSSLSSSCLIAAGIGMMTVMFMV